MITSLKKIMDIIDEIAPLALAEKWDNPGLQVGAFDQEINKVLIALDPTLEVISEAKTSNAQLIITHHPLLFNSISCIDFNTYPGNIIHEAIKNDIAIIAAHTNLDSARMGINYFLARILDIPDAVVLDPKELNGMTGYGLGIIGNLSESIDLFSYTMKVKKNLGINAVKVTGSDDSAVKRVAALGGSGSNFIALAAEKKADLFITGDIGHHDALTARSLNINVIDAGHFSMERAALKGFQKQLKEKLAILNMDIVLELYEDEIDPVRIL